MKNSTEKKLLEGMEGIINAGQKINVTNICKAAGISRQSFYKYFSDVDAFIFWIHAKLFVESFALVINDPEFYRDSFAATFKTIDQNRKFYQKILKHSGEKFKNLFVETALLFYYSYNSNICDRSSADPKAAFRINLYYRGYVYYIEEYIFQRLPFDTDTIVNYLVDTMPPELKEWHSDYTIKVDYNKILEQATRFSALDG